jgi:excinuclease ABC subunit C
VNDVVAFLEGKPEKIIRDLRNQMESASEDLQFERAAKLRDQISAVEEVMARQKVISSQSVDQDVVAVVGDDGSKCVQMFYIRGGKLIGQNSFLLEGEGDEGTQNEAVQEFVKQYYQSAAYVPQEILLPCDIDEVNIIQQWLRQRRGSKVEIQVPARGDKRRLVEMATENAGHALVQIKAEMRAKLESAERALEELADELGLDAPPRRIECYDISNFGAEHFVGSMVVFTNGYANKSEYRRFKIKFHEGKPDDFAMIREIVARRLEEGKKGNPKFARMPDLLIVDGGKGQVASAITAAESAGYRVSGLGYREDESEISDSKSNTLAVAGLAKRFEHLYVPGEPDPVILSRTSQALYLVQRIRDEAHRFANAYRTVLQSKKQVRSALDTIPGIGPTRRKALLRHFGSIEKMRIASLDDLVAAPKMTRASAESVFSYLQQAER